MTLFNHIKNYTELLIFHSVKIVLPKPKLEVNSLLIINTGLIGDLVVSSILLENPNIFKNYDKIYFVINDQYLELFKNYSGKVKFIGYNYKKYKYSLIYKFKFLKMLRKEGFEKCIHLTAARGILNEEMTHLVGAKEVIALNSFWEYIDSTLGKFFDEKYSKIIAKNTLNEYEKHFELMRYLNRDNSQNIFNNGITFSEKNSEKFKKYSNAIIFAPFTSLMNRGWRKEYYLDVINSLKDKHRIVFLGSKNQKRDLEELSNRNKNIIVFAGKLKLYEIPLLLKNAKLFIGQDSGITHIALKLGIPLIAIIGGGEFGRFFPYKESEKVKYLYSKMDCFLCHWACMNSEMFCITEVTPQLLIYEMEQILLVKDENP